MKRNRRLSGKPLSVQRVPEDAQLTLSGSDTLVLIVRGACAVRTSTREAKRFEAGTLVLRQTAGPRLVDRRVTRALELLRADPAKPWTVDKLARAVGLSRAAFARRFAAVTGRSPRRFTSELRLALAASWLESTDDSLAEVAARVGYASEFAFSRAFKRMHGLAPGSFRRLRQTVDDRAIRLAA